MGIVSARGVMTVNEMQRKIRSIKASFNSFMHMTEMRRNAGSTEAKERYAQAVHDAWGRYVAISVELARSVEDAAYQSQGRYAQILHDATVAASKVVAFHRQENLEDVLSEANQVNTRTFNTFVNRVDILILMLMPS